MSIGFRLNDKEHEQYNIFQTLHKKCEYKDAIGGKMTITFIPTGVGVVICVKCQSCNKEENITDFEQW